MAKVTYKDLYLLTNEAIDQRLEYNQIEKYNKQTSRNKVTSTGRASFSDVSTVEIVTAIQALLEKVLDSRVISGLNVTAKSGYNNYITITAGTGTAGGKVFTLEEDTDIPIPFDSSNSLFYVNLYYDGIAIEKDLDTKKVICAKIIIPKPGTTNKVVDTWDGTWNAYIINQKEYKLHGNSDGIFEEDTVELLRNNISPILADNLIGNIKLSENLKVTNTQGTLELDSTSIKLKDVDSNVLAKFDRNGTFFYDTNGRVIAKFSVDGAMVGNISITKNTIESNNFVTNSSGFRIYDNGDAEFNSVRMRGTLYTSYIAENIYIADGISFIGDLLFNGDIAVASGKKIGFEGVSGDTYWMYNSSTQYLEGWVDGTKRIEL